MKSVHPVTQLYQDAMALKVKVDHLEQAIANAPEPVKPPPAEKVVRGRGGKFEKKKSA